MLKLKLKKSSGNLGIKFLSTATRNYISARLLYMNNLYYDGGVMAHEAVEKVMKSILYLLNPSRGYIGEHKLMELKKSVEKDTSLDLSQFKGLFEYYEICYNYRYPDNKEPSSFSSGTGYVHPLDEIFFILHNNCLELIPNEPEKYINGIYEFCQDYFQEISSNNLGILIEGNSYLDKSEIDVAKKFWHDKGIFIKNNGVIRYPNGTIIKEH